MGLTGCRLTERDLMLRAIEVACEQDGGGHFRAAASRLDCEEMVVQLTLWSTLRYGKHGILRSTLYEDGDRLQREMALRHPCGGGGLVDLAIHHAGGGVTLVEVKDGRAGWRSTVAGIGQVSGYAAMAEACGMPVRSKVLLWSTVPGCGNQEVVASACRQAGVVPVVGWGAAELMGFVRSLGLRLGCGIAEEMGVALGA